MQASASAFNWAVLIGALVAASAALSGTLISQRHERKRAHEDRIWAERLRVYAKVMSWAEQWRQFSSYHADPEAPWLTAEPEQPDALLSSNDYAKTQVYGAESVVEHVKSMSFAALGLAKLQADGSPQSELRRPADDTWIAARDLRTAIRNDVAEPSARSQVLRRTMLRRRRTQL